MQFQNLSSTSNLISQEQFENQSNYSTPTKSEWEDRIETLFFQAYNDTGSGFIARNQEISSALIELDNSNHEKNPYLKAHFEDLTRIYENLKNYEQRASRLKTEGCSAKKISKIDILKCATTIDSDIAPEEINNLFDRAFSNPYFNTILTFLASYISENTDFSNIENNNLLHFRFSNYLEPLCFENTVYSFPSLSVFIHEAYHFFQHIKFGGLDYPIIENNTYFEDTFNAAIKSTYKNILKLVAPSVNLAAIDELAQLKTILRQEMPEIEQIECAFEELPRILDITLNGFNIDQIILRSPESPFEISAADNLEQIKYKYDNYCNTIKEKYNLSQEHLVLFERFAYHESCSDFDLEYKTVPDEHCTGYETTELMASLFQLMASNISENVMEILSPMLQYFKTIETLVTSVIEDYTEAYCINESVNNTNLLGQCFID